MENPTSQPAGSSTDRVSIHRVNDWIATGRAAIGPIDR
jgi:hypothetical protein